MMPGILSEFIFIVSLPMFVFWVYSWLRIIRDPAFLKESSQYTVFTKRSCFRLLGEKVRGLCLAGNLTSCSLLLLFAFLWVLSLRIFQIPFLWSDSCFLILVFGLMGFDREYYILPDPAVFLLLWLGILFAILGLSPQSLLMSVVGVMVAYCLMLSIYVFGLLWYRKEAIGRGDLKFSAAIGAWIGGGYIFYFLFIAALIGIMWSSFYFMKSRNDRKLMIPFGPSLGISGIILYFIARFMMVL